jgi:hypothetical protein
MSAQWRATRIREAHRIIHVGVPKLYQRSVTRSAFSSTTTGRWAQAVAARNAGNRP